MITLQELKNKIEEIEKQVKDKGFLPDEISINLDYMNEFKDIELDFIRDEYYGVFVRMDAVF